MDTDAIVAALTLEAIGGFALVCLFAYCVHMWNEHNKRLKERGGHDYGGVKYSEEKSKRFEVSGRPALQFMLTEQSLRDYKASEGEMPFAVVLDADGETVFTVPTRHQFEKHCERMPPLNPQPKGGCWLIHHIDGSDSPVYAYHLTGDDGYTCQPAADYFTDE